jgi:hypothetical protein
MKTKIAFIALLVFLGNVTVKASNFEISCINSTQMSGCGEKGMSMSISGWIDVWMGGNWVETKFSKTWVIQSEDGCFTLTYTDLGIQPFFEHSNLYIQWFWSNYPNNKGPLTHITPEWVEERRCEDPAPVDISCVNHEYIRGTADPLSLFMVSITREDEKEVFAGFRADEDGEFRCDLKGLGLPEWLEGCTLNFYKVEDSGWSVEIEDLAGVVCDPTPIQAPAVTQSIKVYPNPTTDILNISSEKKITKTEVFSLVGEHILSDKSGQANIDVANLATGTYIIQVHTAAGVTSSKFVKK